MRNLNMAELGCTLSAPLPNVSLPIPEFDRSSTLALAAQIPSTQNSDDCATRLSHNPPLSHFPLTNELYPNLSKFEVLLTIYTPILECLSSHLDTFDKLRLTHVSPHLRRLCHSYPAFWAHPDFHLVVREGGGYDSYGIGKVYNLDALLSVLPLEGRLVSLNVDWTAITGHYLFKLVDKCAATLQHLSVRGCRKVSIKHHIVPHFVHQFLIEPYTISTLPGQAGIGSGGWGVRSGRPYRALKSLHAWKARGVRRKPFLIDRKEADGDEPTRYLTTLAAALNIFVDVGLCSTPKLRCPRRREITRRLREKYCVPFDRRWRETSSAVTELVPSLLKRGLGRGINCDGCNEVIGERCEACSVAMHCSNCAKTLCYVCSWTLPFSSGNSSSGSSTSSGDGEGATGGLHSTIDIDTDADPASSGLVPAMRPCCVDTLPYNILISSRSGDIYCEECYDNLEWGRCDACRRQMCRKHEWERRKICGGGCGCSFCFPLIGGGAGNAGPMGVGVVGCDMGGVRQCVACAIFVCRACRSRTGCPCQLCTISFYCRGCWGGKPFSCDGDLMKRKATLTDDYSSDPTENIPLLESLNIPPQPGQSNTESGPSNQGSLHPSSPSGETYSSSSHPGPGHASSGEYWIGPLTGGNGQHSNNQQFGVGGNEPSIFGQGIDDDMEDGLDEDEAFEDEEDVEEEGVDDIEEIEDIEGVQDEDEHGGEHGETEIEGQSFSGNLGIHDTGSAITASSSTNSHGSVMEQMSLLVLDDEGLSRPSAVPNGIQSPVATTPLTPSQTRPGSSAGSGAGTPTEELLDPLSHWSLLHPPSLI